MKYKAVFASIIVLLIIFIMTNRFNCTDYLKDDFSELILNGTIKSKYIEKNNHGYMKLLIHKKEFKVVSCIKTLFETVQVNDSLYKSEGSRNIEIFRNEVLIKKLHF
jgi:hypothetical protein